MLFDGSPRDPRGGPHCGSVLQQDTNGLGNEGTQVRIWADEYPYVGQFMPFRNGYDRMKAVQGQPTNYHGQWA